MDVIWLGFNYSIVNYVVTLSMNSATAGNDNKIGWAEAWSSPANLLGGDRVAFNGRVLAMDDDALFLELLVEVLKSVGIEVVTAADGIEAIRLFQRAKDIGQPFDLVVLDLNIPKGQGGAATLRQIRYVDHQVKIIVASACDFSPLVINYADYGLNGCLKKPFASKDLLRLVLRCLRAR